MPAQEKREALRELARADLYFLLRHVLGRKDVEKQWLFDRCRDVQAEPNNMIDLWSREHYKSTIITYGKTIQDILVNPDITVGIFSHTRPIAKAFLRQIKREFEGNTTLRELFPDICWENPQKQAPKWSEDDGIIVKRKSNPKEATVEAWGVVDGQPTSKHFSLLVYDDVVTKESVTTPEQISKTTDSLALSYSLGAEGGNVRFIGTRYHFADTYREVMARGTAKPRIFPATEDGTPTGEPVLLSAEALAKKRRDMGPYIFSCQMMQNPIADESQGFQADWLRFYQRHNFLTHNLNAYICVDAASSKKKGSDYTAIIVLGAGPDDNLYVLDMVRDRLNLSQRCRAVMDMHKKYRPLQVRYERYGLMADIEHIQDVQRRENYRFDITEVGGQTSKEDRIKRLLPLFEQGRIYLPQTLYYTNRERQTVDLTNEFIEQEYKAFPVPLHDDMLDAMARIAEPDLRINWPRRAQYQNRPTTAIMD